MSHKSFEEMGREADMAIRTTARARQAVIDLGSEAAVAERLSVVITGAAWDNGLLPLQNVLTDMIREQVVTLLPAAISRMKDETRAKTDLLKSAFARQPEEAHGDPNRGEWSGEAPGLPPTPPAVTPPLTGDTGSARGAGAAMPSGPGGSLVPPAEGLGQVPLNGERVADAQAASALKAGADTGLTKPQEETLTYIASSPGCSVGATADVQALVTRKLVTRQGNGPRATYTVTTAGQAMAQKVNGR